MKTRIFFMSGTGNSLWIAKRIASQIGGEVKLTALQSIKEKTVVDAQRIGFLLPVYFADIPDFAKKAIRLLEFTSCTYAFGIVNFGSIGGNALTHLKTEIENIGVRFNAGFSIVMPDNSIVFSSSEKTKRNIFLQIDNKIHTIAEQIISGKENASTFKTKFNMTLLKFVTRVGLLSFYGANKKSATDTCTGCGLCVQFCPVQNISIKNKMPLFANKCVQCFGCAQWCPTRSIRYGRCVINDKTQYTHPEITAKELSAFNKHKDLIGM